MIPISFWLNARKRSVLSKLDGVFSAEWENGRLTTKILWIHVPPSLIKGNTRISGIPPVRWRYLKGIFSFLSEWKVKRVEGTISFPDPMMNGILYGWMSAARAARDRGEKLDISVNFLGENWLKGKFAFSLKTLAHHFRSWIFPLIWEMRGMKVSKGGD